MSQSVGDEFSLCPMFTTHDRYSWRLLERKRLAAASSQSSTAGVSSELLDQISSTRGSSPQNDWSPMSMLDVTRYWISDDSSQYDINCTTLSSVHLPSHVRTQDITHPAGPSRLLEEVDGLSTFAPVFYPSYSLNSALSSIHGSQMPVADSPQSSTAAAPFSRPHVAHEHTMTPGSFNSRSPPYLDDAQIPSVDDGDDQMTAPIESDSSENVLGVINNVSRMVNPRHRFHSQELGSSVDTEPARDSILQINSDDIACSSPPPQDANIVVPPLSGRRSQSPPSFSSRYSPYYRPAPDTYPRTSGSKRRSNVEIPPRLNADLSVTNKCVPLS